MVLLGPNAQIHAHSAATVKLASPHCDSTYWPRNPIFLNLKHTSIFTVQDDSDNYTPG